MLPLVQIRAKYLTRHRCTMFFNYLLIPLMCLIVYGFYLLINGISDLEKHYPYPKRDFPFEDNNYLFTSEGNFDIPNNYSFLKSHGSTQRTCCLVNKKEEGKKLSTFLNSILNTSINYYLEEKEIPEDIYYAIVLDHNEEKDSFVFNFKQVRKDPNYNEPFIDNIFNFQDITSNFLFNTGGEYGSALYESRMIFFELESILSRYLIERKTTKFPNKDINMTYGLNSFPPFTKLENRYSYDPGDPPKQINADGFILNSGIVCGAIISLQFSLIFYIFNIRMVEEKENKLNVFLERQGVTREKYFFSWFLAFTYLSLFPIFVFFISSFFIIDSHYILFFINLLLLNASIFCMMYFFYVCISTVKNAVTILKIVLFSSVCLAAVVSVPNVPKAIKLFFGILPMVNQMVCSMCVLYLETFKNTTWDILWLKANNVSYFESILLYIFDIFFYLGFSWFIISYRDSGLNFLLFIKSFFTKVERTVPQEVKNDNNNDNINQRLIEENNNNIDNNIDDNIDNNINNNIENNFSNIIPHNHQELAPINKTLKKNGRCLKISGVTKKYDDLTAVKNFSAELFPNEIFCLLGHNGAGKTTLIKMISGMETPNEGDVYLNGKSLITNKKYLFENIGLCQQENCFFGYLTVFEHLKYMCEIKGSKTNLAQIRDMLKHIDLFSKKDCICDSLSGGQKRKLCIALALIGNSQLILLDEPTSGMDVVAKKDLWEFLKKRKGNKIIVLTTHSLDEAEYLGDRIGIMSDGEFLCSGTSSYLKEKYPCGFNLNLLLDRNKFTEENKNELINKIKLLEPKLEVKINSKSILSMNIQSDNENVDVIFQTIDELKANKDFGIEDYTVSSTSLEDVFLKINNSSNIYDEYKKRKNEITNLNTSDILVGEEADIQIRKVSFIKQLKSHLKKSLYPLWRNKLMFLLELLSGLGIAYIFALLFSQSYDQIVMQTINYIEVLEANRNYVYEKNKNYLKKSYIYSLSNYITINTVSEIGENINDFILVQYSNSFAHIAKGGIAITTSKTNANIFNVYNTEIPTWTNGYYSANTVLTISAFLKNEYDINAAILPKIEFIGEINETSKDFNDSYALGIIVLTVLVTVFGFVSFLGGLMSEKIKERINNIKHLLYLSGSNMWSYWLSFFIIDFIKIMIFLALLALALSFVLPTIKYLYYDLIIFSFSSLVFIYFLSFFSSKEDSGQKTLFIFIIGFFLIGGFIISALAVFGYKINLSFIYDTYNFEWYDISPLTSIILSVTRIILSSCFSEIFIEDIDKNLKMDKPIEYIKTYMYIQLINFVVYGFLLIICENGILGRFLNYVKVKYLMSDFDFIFSDEKASDDFVYNHNFRRAIFPEQVFNYNVKANGNNTNNQNQPQQQNNINNIDNNPLGMSEQSNLNEINTNTINTNIINTNSIQQNPVINNINPTINIQDINQNQTQINPIPGPLFILPQTNDEIMNTEVENPFVTQQKNKVANHPRLSTVIKGLRKTFWFCCGKNVRAVNNLYLGLEPNEKLALLGYNGSGKTTVIKSILNEILYDYGEISLFGKNTKKDFEELRSIIGYCPQANPLFDFMKVREIIQFYSELKNSTYSPLAVCEQFGLEKYLDTFCVNLSGGNKRKLTFAIALMNRPQILLLDEPSTGVDPDSRRVMWKNINTLSKSGHKFNMILTTHSTEEAEILCDTVAWLKKGNFRCVGSPEKIKIQCSAGYNLHIKFIDLNNVIDNDLNISNKEEENKKIPFNEVFNKMCFRLEGFIRYSNFVMNYPTFHPYVEELLKVVEKLSDKAGMMKLTEIRKDLSFEIELHVIQQKQGRLFSDIFNMKKNNKNLSEISITMESLENILTSI